MPAAPHAKQQWRVSLDSGFRSSRFRLTVRASSTLRLLGSGSAKLSVRLRLGRFFTLLKYSEANPDGTAPASSPSRKGAATLTQKLLKAFRSAFQRMPGARTLASGTRGGRRHEIAGRRYWKDRMLGPDGITTRRSSPMAMPLRGNAASWTLGCCSYLLAFALSSLSGRKRGRLAAAVATICAVSAILAHALYRWNTLLTETPRRGWNSVGWNDLSSFPSW